jgi:hypothetical protein
MLTTVIIIIIIIIIINVWVIRSRGIRWAGACSTYGKSRGLYRVLVAKLEGKRQLGRPKRRWDDNITMDLQEVGCGCMDWIDLAQNERRAKSLAPAWRRTTITHVLVTTFANEPYSRYCR